MFCSLFFVVGTGVLVVVLCVVEVSRCFCSVVLVLGVVVCGFGGLGALMSAGCGVGVLLRRREVMLGGMFLGLFGGRPGLRLGGGGASGGRVAMKRSRRWDDVLVVLRGGLCWLFEWDGWVSVVVGFSWFEV
jgi:hypothetical protein